MPAYLSPAWFDDVNRVAGASDDLRAAAVGASVTIQQVVVGGPSGDVRYWLRLHDGTVEVRPGEAPHPPDATVTQSYETAAAVSRGELSVESALLDGSIRLTGDIPLLVRHQAALLRVGGAFAGVRDRTTYG